MTTDREHRTIAVVVVCVATFLAVGAGVVASDSLDAEAVTAVQETTPAQETTPEDERVAAVSVQNLSAPDRVEVGENFTVSADVVNEGDDEAIRRVTYRISGNVIGSQLVRIPTENATTVVFNVTGANTSGLPAGTFTHGVFTEDAEATANLTLVLVEETTPAETTPEETTVVETTPEETTPVETTPAETTPEETTPEEAPAADLTFESQTSDGTTVVVSSVTVPEGGFVVVHDAGVLEGEVVESIVGQSDYLEAGTQQNVTVELDEPLDESQRLVAVAYRDSNENRTFDFVTSNRTADGPYRQPGEEVAVSDVANVTVEDEQEQRADSERTGAERR